MNTQYAVDEFARRALIAALEGHDEDLDALARDLVLRGNALGESLDALHRGAEQAMATSPETTMAIFDALRRATVRLADGYAAGVADRRDASLRDTTATLAERRAELSALHQVNAAVNSSLDEQSILNMVVHTVAEMMHSDVCSIYLFQPPNSLVLRATHGLNPEAVGRAHLFIGEGLTGRAAHEGKPIAVENLWADPRAKHIPETAEEPFHSMLSVPIIMYTVSKLIGVLNIQTRQAIKFSGEEIAFVEMVCGELALAIENARSYHRTDEQLHRKVVELTTLRRVIALVASTLDFQQVLDTIVDQAVTLSETDAAVIFQLNRTADRLSIVASKGIEAQALPGSVSARGTLGQAIEKTVPLTIGEDGAQGLDTGEDGNLLSGFRSMFCVPFHGRRNTSGAICLYAREQRIFSSDTIDLLAGFAGEAALALENARLYEEAQRSLAAKSALLAEMHHRVKNNLQTVASLLRLGLRHAKSPDVASALQESQARIQSIAAVHDLLSQEDVGLTTVEQVVQKIVGIAEIHFRDPAQRVRFTIAGDVVPVGTQQATTLAIVLNELLSNAMRHAFAGQQEGTIRISYSAEGGRAYVRVTDNGRGLPPSFNLETAKGLGLSIVDTLTRNELHGEIAVRSDGETTFIISFPQG